MAPSNASRQTGCHGFPSKDAVRTSTRLSRVARASVPGRRGSAQQSVKHKTLTPLSRRGCGCAFVCVGGCGCCVGRARSKHTSPKHTHSCRTKLWPAWFSRKLVFWTGAPPAARRGANNWHHGCPTSAKTAALRRSDRRRRGGASASSVRVGKRSVGVDPAVAGRCPGGES